MNDRALEKANQEQTPGRQALTMLKTLAQSEMVEPDEDGLFRFRVGDLSNGGVVVDIFGKNGSPQGGADCLANVVGTLKKGDPDRSIQVTTQGVVGQNQGYSDEGHPEPMSEAECLGWLEEVCGNRLKTDAAA